jgi:hypothetical protein
MWLKTFPKTKTFFYIYLTKLKKKRFKYRTLKNTSFFERFYVITFLFYLIQ